MVSSKCCQVESPSPFRFLAALIPPWAHTECERFTGTIEKRSTSPPISAILMTAASPARPPPTTMIFGAAAILYESDLPGRARWLTHCDARSRIRLPGLIGSREESVHAGRANGDQAKSQRQADVAETAARLLTGGDPPLGGEQPQPV